MLKNISKILKNNSGGKIENFGLQEENLFYRLLHSVDISNFAFENNWPYILQATRNCPCRYINHGSIIYLATKNSNCKGSVVITKMLGKRSIECLKELMRVCSKEKILIIVKNVDDKLKIILVSLGFIETKKPWSKYSFRDDNSYPQLVYKIKQIVDMKGWKHSNRNIINQYSKKFNIATSFYSNQFDKEAKKLLKNYSDYSFKKGKDFKNEIYKSHLFFFDKRIKNKIRLQHIRNRELIGVSFFTKVRNVIFWNALINIDESNIMRILFYESLRFLNKKYPEIEYIISQGSESKGQHKFKLSFRPIFIITKTHMIYQ